MLFYRKMLKDKILWQLLKPMNCKLVQVVDIVSTWIHMSTRGQDHCLTFVQGHSDLYFQTSSSAAKPLCPSNPKFHIEVLWVERTKICSNGPGHMTKMATMPIYGKNPLKIFSKTNRLITFIYSIRDWGPTNFVQMMILGWQWPTYSKVNFAPKWFCMGKCLNTSF